MKRRLKKFLSVLLMSAMVLESAPVMTANAETPESKVADASTLDGWVDYFGLNNPSSSITTENAGAVWTDKSVFSSSSQTGFDKFQGLKEGHSGDTLNVSLADNEFLVALSAMASNETISGETKTPTDTMLILDLSSSMYPSRNPATVQTMVDSVNTTIAKLQSLHPSNRVGVTIYYGGGEVTVQSKSTHGKVLLPLNRYSHASNQFLKVTKNGANLKGVEVNGNVKNSAGSTVSGSHNVADIAGTFAQLGILYAMDEFISASNTTTENRKPIFIFMSDGEPTAATTNYYSKSNAQWGNNQVSTRAANQTDFVTQLTAAYARAKVKSKYNTEPLFYTLSLGTSISVDIMDPSLTRNTTIQGYWEKFINRQEVSLSMMVYDANWNKPTRTFTLTRPADGNAADVITSTAQIDYVDKAFTATTADQLANEFADIVSDISLQTEYFPTLVEGNENLDGYVSFVDRIGEYMNVTSIEGLMIGGKLYTGACLASKLEDGGFGTIQYPTAMGDNFVWAVQERLGISDVQTARNLIGLAYNAGQLSYTNDTNFSNYIGWYADAQGKYVGFWQEGSTTRPAGAEYIVKSYGYLGEPGVEHVEESDMMYAVVQVRHDIDTGEEMVTFAVPAALLPTVTYKIELDEDYDLEKLSVEGYEDGDTTANQPRPIRLLYKVALDPAINEFTVYDEIASDYANVAKKTKDADGNIYFYTNQFQADNTTGYEKVNTYSYFKPSRENGKYYFQDDEIIYQISGGGTYTVYTGASKPTYAANTYFREHKIFKKNGSGFDTETVYTALTEEALGTALSAGSDRWYIPRGNVHKDIMDDNVAKGTTDNKTNTLPNVNEMFVDIHGHTVNETNHRFVVGSTLGNNGRVMIKPQTGIMISKTVDEAHSSDPNKQETFTFTITRENTDIEAVTFNTTKVAVDGTKTTGTLSFAANSTTAMVELKHGETIYITGMDAGKTYTVTEGSEDNYVLSKVQVNGSAVTGTSAELTTVADEIQKADFTNTARGVGNITISKYVRHSAGEGYELPTHAKEKVFDIDVTLSFNEAPLRDKTYAVEVYDLNSDGNGTTEGKIMTDAAGKATLKLAHNEQVEILNLPEGTVVTVVEPTPGSGYSASYEVNGTVQTGTSASITLRKTVEESVAVVNTYTPQASDSVGFSIGGTKSYVDAAGVAQSWGTKTFSFKLQKYNVDNQSWDTYNASTGSWSATGVDASATVSDSNQNFTIDLTEAFTKPGNYAYQVFEVIPTSVSDNTLYDRMMHTFHVTVVDDNGKLKVSTVISDHDEGHAGAHTAPYYDSSTQKWIVKTDFKNVTYNQRPVAVTIPIQKILASDSSASAELNGYHFGLYTDEACTAEAVAGTVNNSAGGTGKADNGILRITKSATDTTGEGQIEIVFDTPQASPYVFYLKEKTGTNTNMNYSQAVTKVEIQISTQSEGGEEKLVLTSSEYTRVADSSTIDHDGVYNESTKEVEFTNSHQPITLPLTVKKELTGRDLIAGEFTFEIKDKDGNSLSPAITATNDADGNVNLNLPCKKVGLYHYQVVETSTDGNGVTTDKTVYNVYVTVSLKADQDGKKGLHAEYSVEEVSGNTMTFKNSYKAAPGEATIRGTKTLTNRGPLADEFVFELYEEGGTTPIQSVGIAAGEKETAIGFQFDKLTYDTVGEYKYVVKEKIPQAAVNNQLYGVTYDTTVYDVKVEVFDNASGVLQTKVWVKKTDAATYEEQTTGAVRVAFNNEYDPHPATVTFGGTKTLVGKDITDGAFTFELYKSDAQGNPDTNDLQSVTNTGENFTFNAITYTQAGTYYYIIKEKLPDDATAANGYTSGDVIYDTDVFYVKVDVVDDLKNVEMDATVNIYTSTGAIVDNIRFVNSAIITGDANVTIEGTKTLTGRTMKAGEFTFELCDENGNVLQTMTNDANGKFKFDLTYEDTTSKTYNYTIKEKAGNLPYVTYDAREYHVKVEVSVDPSNQNAITTKLTYDDEIVFNNRYDQPSEDDDDDDDDKEPTPTPKKTENVDSPDTGDDSNAVLWIVLVAAALIALLAAFLFWKKKK